MQRLLATLAARRAGTAFPGRVRMVAASGRESAMAACGWEVEWPGADATESIAGLAAIAVWEQARGGLAVAVIDGAQVADGTAMPALVMAARIATPCLLAVVAPDDRQRAFVTAAGWTWSDGQEVRGPVAVAITGDAGSAAEAVRRGRWAPLRLSAVREWSTRSGDPLADLAVLAAREPRILLANAVAPWRDLPPGPALLAALAASAGEGRRICWQVPATVDLRDAAAVLRRMAERGRAMTLVVDGFDTSSLGFWATVPGWWVTAPADDGELRAVLARALAADDLMVVARQSASVPLPWPAGTAHEAGSGRWLAQDAGAKATIVCVGALAGEALRAREAMAAIGVAVSVYHVTSVQPLPEHELVGAAGHGPLVVADDGDPAVGLAGAIARLGIPVVPVGHGPLAADLAAAVRAVS